MSELELKKDMFAISTILINNGVSRKDMEFIGSFIDKLLEENEQLKEKRR